MQVVTEKKQIQDMCRKWRTSGESICFVPTMGCLHEGHLSLIKKAQSCANRVVVSIFVNPLQFGDMNDFANYPNTFDDDVRKLAEIGVDCVFSPEVNSLYPEGEAEVEQVEIGGITSILEGKERPGHFAGVATVVKRLFDLIAPNSAIFGKKDFQQLMVIRKLIGVFSMNIEIIGMPTLRESDGLAMSSRNVRLSEKQRVKAPEIYHQLESIKAALNEGATNYNELETEACDKLSLAGFVPDYVVIRESTSLLPPKSPNDSIIILAAAKLGDIRLIDNLEV